MTEIDANERHGALLLMAVEMGRYIGLANANFSGMPDAVWVKAILPKAYMALRSNNRDVQARMCASGAGLAVLCEVFWTWSSSG